MKFLKEKSQSNSYFIKRKQIPYLGALFLLLCLFTSLSGHLPTKENTINNRVTLEKKGAPWCVSIPEGEFVYCFHPKIKPWIKERLNQKKIQKIRDQLSNSLRIPFSKEGFTMASSRKAEEMIDQTSYSAIWVRDSCWHYFGMKIGNRKGAKKILLKLLDFYSSPHQMDRFIKIIKDPSIADPKVNSTAYMDVPLIRFCRKTLSHHQVDGKDQQWNHLQFDSHALFLLAICDGLQSTIITEDDISTKGYKALCLFPAFFHKTNYWERKDSGPWEEQLQHNASTIGLITASLKEFKKEFVTNKETKKKIKKAISLWNKTPHMKKITKDLHSSLTQKTLKKLIKNGISQVNYNLSLGAESPNLSIKSINRKADAALFFLCLPDNSLFSDNVEKMQQILNINLGLIGPYGVFRYKLDSYQAMNYWVDSDLASSIEGKKTKELSFITRFKKGYLPKHQPYDAQWFFDSVIAAIHYNISMKVSDDNKKSYYLQQGDIHLKRALGQLTSSNAIAANGEKISSLSLPESINTVNIDNYTYKAMPSPICPLGWATASMRIALEKAENAHHHFEVDQNTDNSTEK